MSMNQFKEQFIKNLTHEELITEYEAKFALCEHLEDEVQRLSRERSKLAEEVVSLEVKLNTSEAKLSEFQEGLPIEKAKELDEVLIIGWDSSSTDGVFWQEAIGHVEGTYLDAAIATWTKVPTSDGTYRYEWFDENNGVIYKNPKAFFTPPVLPSTETNGGYVND